MSTTLPTIEPPVFRPDVLEISEPLACLGDEFPESFYLLNIPPNRWAFVNTTTLDNDVVNVLACFETIEQGQLFQKTSRLPGHLVSKTFDEARDIALLYPNVAGLGIQRDGATAVIHWVR